MYAEHIRRTAGLKELQVRIKSCWRNINDLRYADDNTVMAESGTKEPLEGEGGE